MAIMNKDRQPHGFTVGQIVYMYNPSGGKLQTGSRKIQCHFVGPLAIYKCIVCAPQPGLSPRLVPLSLFPYIF